MSTTSQESSSVPDEAPSTVSFDDKDSRKDEMREATEGWLDELAEATESAAESEAFREWLDVQSRFHDYSLNNTLLIRAQKADATTVAGFNTWMNEFDRYVQEGEEAIWIWAPIVSDHKCPECGNAPSYHDRVDCTHDEESDPKQWSSGVVGFRPASVFDVSQTEGEPLPELETAAEGDASNLYDALPAVAAALGIEFTAVEPDDWSKRSEGTCDTMAAPPVVEVLDDTGEAKVAGVTFHEFAHAALHQGVERPEREDRELEAEATAYIVGRHFGLDMSGSALYLAAWKGDDTDELQERLTRINGAAESIIEAVEGVLSDDDGESA